MTHFFPYFNLEHPPNLRSLAFWNSCLFDLWMWDILPEPFISKFRILPCIPSCLLHMLCLPTLSAVPLSSCTHIFSCRLLALPASHQPAPCCLWASTASAPASHCWATVEKAAWLGQLLWEKSAFFSSFAVSLIRQLWSLHSSSVLISALILRSFIFHVNRETFPCALNPHKAHVLWFCVQVNITLCKHYTNKWVWINYAWIYA